MAQIPAPHQNDFDDVSVALEVAQAQWGRGDVNEALKWLRKAAESAFEGGDDRRGIELSKITAEFTAEARAARSSGRASMPSMHGAQAPVPAQGPVPAASKFAAPKQAPAPVTPVAGVETNPPSVPSAHSPSFSPPRAASFPPPRPGSFPPPRAATFPPPPISPAQAPLPRTSTAAEETPKRTSPASTKKPSGSKSGELKSARPSPDSGAKKGATQPLVAIAPSRKSSMSAKPTASRPSESARKSSKSDPKLRSFEEDEATREWAVAKPSRAGANADESSVSLSPDDWNTIDEPIDLNTPLEVPNAARAEAKSSPKLEVRARMESGPEAKDKRRSREAIHHEPLVSRPFTQAVRVAVSRNATGVIVARLLDMPENLREGEVEAMLVGLRAGELEDLFR